MENKEYYVAPTKDIIVSKDRIRKVFEQKPLEDLARSINMFGQIQPGVCVKREDGKYALVAGERRLRACEIAAKPFTFLLREDIDPKDKLLRAIELEENVLRIDLTWKEKADALAELHELYQEKGAALDDVMSGSHRIQDTADLLGKSKGIVSEDLELAFWADKIPEVADAKNKSEAKKIIKRLKEGIKRNVALDQAVTRERAKLEGDGITTPIKVLSDKEKFEARLLEYDKRIIHGTMEEELTKLDKKFDIVLFDPPWGVDYMNVKMNGGSTGEFNDDIESFESALPKWLHLLWENMSDNSFLFMFFAIRHYNLVYTTLASIGFETNGIPYIWHKQGAHHTRNPDIWPGRCYEPIVYARKGKKSMVQKGAPDIIKTPSPTPKIKGEHPAAKHPMIFRELLERAATPGDKILDPMCGSGMAGVAAESIRPTHMLDWYMIELDENFRQLSFFNVNKGYGNIIGDFDVPVRDHTISKPDFKTMNPGSDIWKDHWRAYPEDQEAMLKWREEK